MAEKTFVNNSPATLEMIIAVREGDSPFLNSSFVSFTLLPGETETVTYGDAENPFLNGIILFTIYLGDLYSKVQFITELGSELDNLLNTNNQIIVTKVETDYVYTGANTFLEAVNDAQTALELQAAIENPGLGLDLSVYNTLTAEQKLEVATSILNNRPIGGYPSVASVQLALDAAINELVIPTNIFVRAGEIGGNGSFAHPFGTIQEGIAAVSVGGTVNILAGTYPITSQINVNKSGITIRGEVGTLLMLQADLIPLLVTAPDTTIEGLTITSDIPYQKEFIQVGGANTTIRNNTIFGPVQPPPMANWVVNRAIVPQVGVQNILIENNTMHSLRTGVYINPNVTGLIQGNIIYNTKGGLLVDRALTVLVENSWGTPPNEFDIVLLAGTTTGPPYDNVTALSLANNNATISDQRGL
ncbi:hypothetical protein UACE39S_00328 [Ureibacillus acetophenoni]